jgi:hypothetical protein
MSRRLRLRAEDAEDIAIVAACLQDALVPVGDLRFLPDERLFVGVVNRFCWETAPPEPEATWPRAEDARFVGVEHYQRVLSALCFETVRKVTRLGFDQRDHGYFLELLTIEPADGTVTLIFAEGIKVRLEVDRIACTLRDLVEPWPTQWRPRHRTVDDDAARPGAASNEPRER